MKIKETIRLLKRIKNLDPFGKGESTLTNEANQALKMAIDIIMKASAEGRKEEEKSWTKKLPVKAGTYLWRFDGFESELEFDGLEVKQHGVKGSIPLFRWMADRCFYYVTQKLGICIEWLGPIEKE